jgi:hypothetical protein
MIKIDIHQHLRTEPLCKYWQSDGSYPSLTATNELTENRPKAWLHHLT